LRSVLVGLSVVCLLVGTALSFACASPVDMIDVYIPSDSEVSTFLNLQEYLKQYNEDTGKLADQSQFGSLVDLSQKYAILQTYLFEAFVQTTPNRSATTFYREYAENHWPHSQSVAVTASLMDRPTAPKPGPGQTPTYALPNGKSARR
jgi:hypothetical protein